MPWSFAGGSPEDRTRIAMFEISRRSAVVALALLPVAAAAEPIKLDLAFFSSDRANVYLAAIKPFVNAVNANLQMMEQLKSDPKRTVVFPSKSDMETAAAAFRAVTDETMNQSPHSREILQAAKSEIANLRASE
jgi:hypothetical protein